MKSTKQTPKVNYEGIAMEILKTLVLLEKSYGAAYIVRILQGNDKFGLRKDEHAELETFGSCTEVRYERLHNVIHFLLKNEYLEVANLKFGNLRITEKGKELMSNFDGFKVPRRATIIRREDELLKCELKEIRKTISEKAEIRAFEVFTDYTLSCIVAEKPENVTELKQIPGIGDAKVDQFGHQILSAIQRVREEVIRQAKARREYKAKSPSHQSVKELFLAGKSIAEIGKVRSIQPTTVMQYLETMHLVGEVDMTQWIETQVKPKDLHKGAEYFKNVENPRLMEALEVLGLNMETLKLCKLYVAHATTGEAELKLAS